MREATAREMKHYYLQCLHQLVNGGGGTNGLLGDCHTQPTPAAQEVRYQSLHAVQQFPSHTENLDPNLQSGDTANCIHVASTAFSTSNNNGVLRKHDLNSCIPTPLESQPKKMTVRSEKQQSKIGGSSSSRAQLHGPKASASARVRTDHSVSSINRKSVAGKSKNLEGSARHQSVKGAQHHSGHLHVGAGGGGERTGALSVKNKKDPLGHFCTGKQTVVSAKCAPYSASGGGVKMSKSTRRSSSTDKQH